VPRNNGVVFFHSAISIRAVPSYILTFHMHGSVPRYSFLPPSVFPQECKERHIPYLWNHLFFTLISKGTDFYHKPQ